MIYTFKSNQKVYNFILKSKIANSKAWQCECSCGNLIAVDESDLLSGNKQSCGCKTTKIKRANPFMTYFIKEFDEPMIIYPNTPFKDFMIIEQSENEGYWKCLCNLCNEISEIHEIDIINNVKIKCKCITGEIEEIEPETPAEPESPEEPKEEIPGEEENTPEENPDIEIEEDEIPEENPA